jgi:hypothetical protein
MNGPTLRGNDSLRRATSPRGGGCAQALALRASRGLCPSGRTRLEGLAEPGSLRRFTLVTMLTPMKPKRIIWLAGMFAAAAFIYVLGYHHGTRALFRVASPAKTEEIFIGEPQPHSRNITPAVSAPVARR